MKVTLDLSKLLEEGKITPAEAERFQALSARGTGALGINILLGFGVVAVSAGAMALLPSVFTAIPIGVVAFAIGLGLILSDARQWEVLAQILLVIGALMVSAATIALGNGSLASMLGVTAMLTVGSIVARSSLLMAMAVLAASACLGARTGYEHAMYSLAIYEPTLTIVLFSLIALGTFLASKRLPADYERIAITAARTSVFIVNFGFWIGSLWGDPLVLIRSLSNPGLTSQSRWDDPVIPAWVFSVGWAIALLALALWALKANRRWVINVAAVFGAIHFYTQWFERLGATPGAILIGGLLMLALALALWVFNRRSEASTA